MDRAAQSADVRTVRAIALLLIAFVVDSVAPQPAQPQSANAERLAEAEGLGWAVGAADAAVTVIEFTDVSCPYCASFHSGTRASLHEEFVASGKVRWITLSYVSGLYPNSAAVSVAAECAGAQGRFEDFMAAAYTERDSWLRAGHAQVATAVGRFARQTDLDIDSFEACRLDTSASARIERIVSLAREVGVRGTPMWFVDGFPVMGDLPLGYARQFITSQLPG